MTKTRDYLRDAQTHELISGLFGWLWLGGSLAGVVLILMALFGDNSWWLAIGVFLAAQFCKSVSRSYTQAAQEAMREGLANGALSAEANGRVVRSAPLP